MKNLKTLLLSTVILLISGCGLTPAPEPQEVVSDMITNMQSLTASTFNIESTVKQNDSETGTSVDADINISGQSNFGDSKIPSTSLDVAVNLDTKDAEKGDMNGDVKFLLTITDNNLYFKLENLTLPEELQQQVGIFVSLYKGNWYKFPSELIPDDYKDDMTEESDADKEKLKALFSNAQLFEILESSTKNGQYIYKTLINQEGLKNLVQEFAKLENEPMSAEDLVEFDKFFEEYTHDIVLYINQDSHYLDKIEVAITSKDTANQLDIKLMTSISNHNKTQEITIPEDAQDFNPMALMGLGMMVEGSQGTSLNEDAGDFEDIDLGELEGMDMTDLENEMQEMGQELDDLGESMGQEMEGLEENLESDFDTIKQDLPIIE